MFLDRVDTATGTLVTLTDTNARLLALHWEDGLERVFRLLRRRYGDQVQFVEDGRSAVRDPVERYFSGELSAIDALAVETGGTEFQRRVWSSLRSIPAGRTCSYGELAARLGCPKAVRAVGLANGANPVAIVIPCHRVIGSNGSLTGYGGGLDRKRWLLAHEGVDVEARRLF